MTKIKLRSEGIRWPKNSFLLTYQATTQTYHLFIKELLIAPILSMGVDWPDIIKPILAVHPQGQLENTQIGIEKGHITTY